MADMQEMAECQGPAVTLSLLSQMFQIYSVQNHVKNNALYLQFESMRSCYAFKLKKRGETFGQFRFLVIFKAQEAS